MISRLSNSKILENFKRSLFKNNITRSFDKKNIQIKSNLIFCRYFGLILKIKILTKIYLNILEFNNVQFKIKVRNIKKFFKFLVNF
ncbi:hypothetical protein (nucleomorph) [Guillardia theta]|uniref:Uncharacterized protein n=1 Tax=Guillardia theta TaxID=55529 RepID=Q98RP1_GUITH|nr:hypothetical protein GTHECHR1113 [Guillardia theta]AAK39906.1 hypothetical protein [Guillardia theta]